MARALTSEVLAEIAKGLVRPFHLFEAVFDDATVRNTDAYRDITAESGRVTSVGEVRVIDTGEARVARTAYITGTFIANGHFVGFEDLSETSGLELARVRVALSGVDQAWISDILTRKYIGRQLTIWRGFLDDESNVIADPYILFQGTMDEPGVVDDPSTGKSVVSVIATNDFAKWDEPNGRRTNDAEQQLHFPGDKAFEFVSQINRQLRWGRRVIDTRPRGNPNLGSPRRTPGDGGDRGRAEGGGGSSGGGIGHSGGDATGGTRA